MTIIECFQDRSLLKVIDYQDPCVINQERRNNNKASVLYITKGRRTLSLQSKIDR